MWADYHHYYRACMVNSGVIFGLDAGKAFTQSSQKKVVSQEKCNVNCVTDTYQRYDEIYKIPIIRLKISTNPHAK